MLICVLYFILFVKIFCLHCFWFFWQHHYQRSCQRGYIITTGGCIIKLLDLVRNDFSYLAKMYQIISSKFQVNLIKIVREKLLLLRVIFYPFLNFWEVICTHFLFKLIKIHKISEILQFGWKFKPFSLYLTVLFIPHTIGNIIFQRIDNLANGFTLIF